jgi:sporulation protein YlmC with PRC-barrel domain
MATHTHDHSHLKRFSELSGYKLEESHQDIRNLPLYDKAGVEIGRIDDLLVDESSERVAAIRLEDGTTRPVEPLEIQSDKVIDHGMGHTHAAGAKVYTGRTVRTT